MLALHGLQQRRNFVPLRPLACGAEAAQQHRKHDLIGCQQPLKQLLKHAAGGSDWMGSEQVKGGAVEEHWERQQQQQQQQQQRGREKSDVEGDGGR